MSDDSFNRQREEFPTLSRGIHLLSHSLGPVPRAAHDSMNDYLARWDQHVSEDAWAVNWWELSNEVGNLIAKLIGATPGTVQIQPTASVAMSCVASCFDFASGAKKKIVTTALDFPSMGYVWEAQRRAGAEVCIVASDNDIVVPTQRICEAIDTETCLVALSHVSYRSSARVDAKAIVDRAHACGAMVALDAYQSVGTIRVEAATWGVDFLLGGSIKWLCGGPACGYLYVRPDLIDQLEPKLTGWIAHRNPFDFSHDGLDYDTTVRRFAQGTPNIPGLHSFLPGLKIINEVGIEFIERESRRRTQRIVEFARQRGWPLHSPVEVDDRGGSVMIEVDRPQEFVTQLAKRRVFVDCRPGVGLRLSPHFFTTDDEVDETLEHLAELMP